MSPIGLRLISGFPSAFLIVPRVFVASFGLDVRSREDSYRNRDQCHRGGSVG
jgi:hypothetical protein